MRIVLATACLISFVNIADAQTTQPSDPKSSETKSGETKDSEHSTGRTLSPDAKGQWQPQGWTGPTNTTTGGAPAASPQGQSPPGMQAAPDGSSKTIVDPPKK
jgi:hypothetical protein